VFHIAQSQPSLPHCATPQFRPFAIRHDAAVRSCLATILHSAMTDTPWAQAGLPMGQRGLGLAHASDLSAAAFLGSLQGASAAVTSLNTVGDSVPREDPTVALARDVLLAQIEDPSVRASVPSIADLRTLLCVTRTRVPYIASTTLVHRNIVNIVISYAHFHLSTLFPHKTQRSNQPYSLIRFDQDGLSQIRAKPRHSRQNLCHKIRLRRPQKGRSKT
jgi:hypothetical protein